MPFMLVGTGPLGIGIEERLASSAEPVEHVGHLGPLSACRASDVLDQLGQRHLALVVADDDLVDRDLGDHPVVAPLLEAIIGRSRLGLPSPIRTMPGGPTSAVDHVLLLVERDQLVGLPAAPQHPERAGRGAGRALHLVVRRGLGAAAEEDDRAEQAEQQRADDRQDQAEDPGAGQQREHREADGRTDHERPSSHRPIRGSVCLVIR